MVSSEQKTEIRNIIVENKVDPTKPSFSVSVGVAVPKTVELHPLPPRVVEILPAYRSYRYFVLADNRIGIVEPDTLRDRLHSDDLTSVATSAGSVAGRGG
ncbi:MULTISPECIES: DUF1236 domain-containing protein [Neorhizobium]|uniref:DUF1236 domain-containing protein n=1 Tax=Neorhizobium TaxID=1525371 RepID=UPI00155DE1E4|nr:MULTISPECIES: DUF1236 domain-containing protein [Neorhizobium]